MVRRSRVTSLVPPHEHPTSVTHTCTDKHTVKILMIASLASLAQLIPQVCLYARAYTCSNPALDSSLCRAAAAPRYCVHFSCCSPDCASAAAPRLRLLRLLLPDCVRLCSIPDCSPSCSSPRPGPNILRGVRGSVKYAKVARH